MLGGDRFIDADGDLQSPGRFQLVHIAAFEVANETALLDRISREDALAQWLKTQHAAGAVIGATGAAVFLLAEAGLLDKGIAAVPRELSALFRRRYPHIRIEMRAPVAEHESVYTTGALATEWQLVSVLVERATSTHTAGWLAVTTGLQRTRDSSALVSADPLVAAAQFWLGERFVQPFRISDLTRDLSVSHSTLIRRFQRRLSTTPRRYVQMLRIESAKVMLTKTNRSIDQISLMVGYADTRSFRAAFREHAGIPPTAYRTAASR